MRDKTSLYESAGVWDQGIQPGQKALVRAILDFMPKDTERIVDLGCGDGKITSALIAATGKKILGVDSSAEALSRCNFQTKRADITALDFKNGQFDAVITTDVLEHLPDDVERAAWRELFRVASKSVLVAVPFREDLLEAMSRCRACRHCYHVNWHQRAYDWSSLVARAPEGWHVGAVVFTGEAWSPYHPFETAIRRRLLGDWAGWADSVCPNCGATGAEVPPSLPLSPVIAAALGRTIYADLHQHGLVRSHSEVLVLYRRNKLPKIDSTVLGDVSAEVRSACHAVVDPSELHPHLTAYPRSARLVSAADGGVIVQLPLYGAERELFVEWGDGAQGAINISIEDGLGALYAGAIEPGDQPKMAVPFSREAFPGYYGLLVRLPHTSLIKAVGLSAGPMGIMLVPKNENEVGYHRVHLNACEGFVQVTRRFWFQEDWLRKPAISQDFSAWVPDMFRNIELLATAGATPDQMWVAEGMVARCNGLEAERDALYAELQALKQQQQRTFSARFRAAISRHVDRRKKGE